MHIHFRILIKKPLLRRTICFLALLSMMLSTAACSDGISEVSASSNSDADASAPPMVATSNDEQERVFNIEELDLPEFSANSLVNSKYLACIERLETTGILPDGEYCYVGDSSDFEHRKSYAYEDYVAVYDVNNDGRQELLLIIGGTATADNNMYVYQYDDRGQFTEQFSFFAHCTFYDGGMIYAGWSHASYVYIDGFWPYYVFQYNENTEEYDFIAGVEEMDLEAITEDVSLEEAEHWTQFPYEYDYDDDGKLYVIEREDDEKEYLDEEAYNEWKQQTLSTEKLEIEWFSLSSD